LIDLILRSAFCAIQLERKVTALKDELVQEQEQSAAARATQTAVSVHTESFRLL